MGEQCHAYQGNQIITTTQVLSSYIEGLSRWFSWCVLKLRPAVDSFWISAWFLSKSQENRGDQFLWLSFVLFFVNARSSWRHWGFSVFVLMGLKEKALSGAPWACRQHPALPRGAQLRPCPAVRHSGGAGAARAGQAVIPVTCPVLPVCLCSSEGWEQVLWGLVFSAAPSLFSTSPASTCFYLMSAVQFSERWKF